MRRIFWLGVALTVAMLAPACASQKKPAEAAMAHAVQAYNAIKEQATNIVPDEAKSIEDAIAAATAQLQGGDYKGALAAATSLDTRVKDLADSLPDKTKQAQSAWAELSGSIPGTIATLDKRLKGLTMPAAGTPHADESPVVVLTGLKASWTDAQAAATAGRLAEAVSKGTTVRDGAVKLLNDLQAGS